MITLHKDKPTYGYSHKRLIYFKHLPDGACEIYITCDNMDDIPTAIEFGNTCIPNTYMEVNAVEITKEEFNKILKQIKAKVRSTKL